MLKDKRVFRGQDVGMEYHDCDNFSDLPDMEIKQVYGVCFCNNKVVIGQRVRDKSWGLIGGKPEEGETLLETLEREIQEESNMKVLEAVPIGYQIITIEGEEPFLQIRYAALVKPYGAFLSDPDEHNDSGIAGIKLIKLEDYKKYFDWGEIGDRIMERALEIKHKNF